MADPIIQSYLNDTTIPPEKRQYVLSQIKSGAPESVLSSAIATKYPQYANKGAALSDSFSVGGLMNAAQSGIQSGISALKANPADAITKGVMGVATAPIQAASAFTKTNDAVNNQKFQAAGLDKYQTPEQVPSDTLASLNSPAANDVLAKRKVDDQMKTINETSNYMGNLANPFQMLNQAGQNFGKATVDANKMAYGGLAQMGQGAVQAAQNPYSQEGSKTMQKGFMNIVGGGMTSAFSPITAVTSAMLPQGEASQAGQNALAAGIGNTTKSIAGPINRAIAPVLGNAPLSDQELEDQVAQPMIQAGNLGLLAMGMDQEKSSQANAPKTEPTPTTVPEEGPVSVNVPKRNIANIGAEDLKAQGVHPELADAYKSGSETDTLSAFKKEALRKGYKEQYVNMLDNLDQPSKDIAVDYIDAGLRKLENPVEAPSVWQHASKEVSTFIDQAAKAKSDIGKRIGDVKATMLDKPLNETLPTAAQDINTGIQSVLEKNNALKNGAINVKSSILSESPSLVKTIGNITDDLKSGDMTVRDVEGYTTVLNNVIQAEKGTGGIAQMAREIKGVLEDQVNNATPEMAELNSKYSQISKNLQQVQKASTEYLENGKKNFDPTVILKRSLGDNAAKYQAAFEAMQNIEDTTGIKAPTNLKLKAELANMAEDVTASNAPRNLKGQVEAGKQLAAEKIPGVKTVLGTAEVVKQLFTGPEQNILKGATKLKEILQNKATAGEGATLSVNDINKLTKVLNVVTKLGGVIGVEGEVKNPNKQQ